MTAEAFLKKWGFLPPVRYQHGLYSIDATYATLKLNCVYDDLSDILSRIDHLIEEYKENN